MATSAEQSVPAQTGRWFFLGMAAAILVTVFIGFAPSYYLLPWIGGVTVRGQASGSGLTPLVHFHAAIFSAWVLIFGTQAALVARQWFTLHRRLGLLAALIAVVVFAVGIWTSIYSARLGNTPPGWANDEAFLAVPFTALALFAGFVIAGFANRHRGDYHKRFMLLGTLAMLVPALARIMRMADWPLLPPGVWGALIILNIYFVALIVFDLKVMGRVHPATISGVAIHLISWPFRLTFGYTELWQSFARTLIQ